MIGGTGEPGTVRTNASATMVTVPAEGAVVSDPQPLVKANLASLGEVDAGSLVVRVSGVGKLDVKYDALTKLMEAHFLGPIRERENVVIVSGKSGTKRFELRWTFIYEAKAGEAKPGGPELRIPAASPAAVPAEGVGSEPALPAVPSR